MNITTQLIKDSLRNYDKIKRRLAGENMLFREYLSHAPYGTCSLYRSPSFQASVMHSGFSDPTSYVALKLADAHDHKLPNRIEKLFRMHNEQQRLVSALDTNLIRLAPREQALIRMTYLEHEPPMKVAMMAHLSLSALYRERDRAEEHLTTLIRASLNMPSTKTS